MNQNDTQPPEDVASSSNPEGTGWQPAWQVNQLPSRQPHKIPTEYELSGIRTSLEQSNNSHNYPQSQVPYHTSVQEGVRTPNTTISSTRFVIIMTIAVIMWGVAAMMIRQYEHYGLHGEYFTYTPQFFFIIFSISLLIESWLLSGNRRLICIMIIACLLSALINADFSYDYLFDSGIDYHILMLIGILLFLGTMVFIWRERRGQNLIQAVISNQGMRPQKGSVPMVDNTVMPTSELRGQVHGFRERTETRGSGNPFAQHTPTIVWTYRLERYHDGERLDPIPVEMRGHSFTGLINDGDEIMINKKWRKGKMLRTNRVFNLTSGAEVKTLRRISANTIAHIVFYIFLAAIIFFWLVYLGN